MPMAGPMPGSAGGGLRRAPSEMHPRLAEQRWRRLMMACVQHGRRANARVAPLLGNTAATMRGGRRREERRRRARATGDVWARLSFAKNGSPGSPWRRAGGSARSRCGASARFHPSRGGLRLQHTPCAAARHAPSPHCGPLTDDPLSTPCCSRPSAADVALAAPLVGEAAGTRRRLPAPSAPPPLSAARPMRSGDAAGARASLTTQGACCATGISGKYVCHACSASSNVFLRADADLALVLGEDERVLPVVLADVQCQRRAAGRAASARQRNGGGGGENGGGGEASAIAGPNSRRTRRGEPGGRRESARYGRSRPRGAYVGAHLAARRGPLSGETLGSLGAARAAQVGARDALQPVLAIIRSYASLLVAEPPSHERSPSHGDDSALHAGRRRSPRAARLCTSGLASAPRDDSAKRPIARALVDAKLREAVERRRRGGGAQTRRPCARCARR